MPEHKLDIEAVGKAVDDIKTGFEELKAASLERDKELLTKGAVDTLLDEKLARITEDMGKNQKIVDQLYTESKRKHLFLDGKEVDVADLDQKAQEWADGCARSREETKAGTFTNDDLATYGLAFKRMMQRESGLLTPDELKALSAGSSPDGGYTITPDMSGRMVKRIFETSQMRQYASVQVISTSSLEGVYDLNEATSGWVGETASRTETSTPQIDKWSIPVHEQYAEPRTTQKVLDDSAINIEAWLADKIADKMARTENTAFVTGNGVNKPRGFLDYASGTTLPGTIQRYITGVNGDFAADPNGADKMIEMIYGLKGPYRDRASWFMNATTMGKVMLLKDSNGRMLWQPALTAGQPSTLLGYAVSELADMPDLATGSLSVAFGDMAEAYQIVERQGTRVLRDPFTAKPYVKFYTTRRVGGDVNNFEAIKFLEFTA